MTLKRKPAARTGQFQVDRRDVELGLEEEIRIITDTGYYLTLRYGRGGRVEVVSCLFALIDWRGCGVEVKA